MFRRLFFLTCNWNPPCHIHPIECFHALKRPSIRTLTFVRTVQHKSDTKYSPNLDSSKNQSVLSLEVPIRCAYVIYFPLQSYIRQIHVYTKRVQARKLHASLGFFHVFFSFWVHIDNTTSNTSFRTSATYTTSKTSNSVNLPCHSFDRKGRERVLTPRSALRW